MGGRREIKMEEKKIFSEEQEKAINTRDRTLLVSAAAGSGKTTTLTERIIRSLLDTEKPESIQNMLIVTFTNASVFDLREKISGALKKAAAENPENKRLEAELYALDTAKIMTIDAFCSELVRMNAERLGITPAFRIADSAEALLLERGLLSALTEAAYRGELMPDVMPEAFELLCDALTGVKNTASLADRLISLYEKTKSMVKGVEIFDDFANNYLQYSEKQVEETPYGKYAMDMARASFEYLPKLLSHYTEPLAESGDASLLALAAQISEISDRFSSLSAAKLGYSQLRERILAFDFPKAVSIKNPKPDEALAAIDYRQSFKDSLTKLKKSFFSYSEEEWQKLYRDMAGCVFTLGAFLKAFSKLYFEEKKKRGSFEFSDVERLAYDCLYENGELTEVAKSYRSLFSSVYIDEYQDVNELQNKIFEAVSPDGSKFMVGDIKQSIYGFRSARPEIFSQMKTSFPPLSSEYAPESSIFMSNNYRCDEGIIDFVNEVFEALFGAVKESIGYVSEDRLVFKKSYKGFTPEYEKAKICIVKKTDTEESESEENSLSPDAEFIARTVEELIRCTKRRDGSPIKPDDIAILCRTKKNFSVYKEALEARGIGASAPEDKDFFMNKEILLTLSLLSAIDNPRKDIHLASLMCSPLYDFTPDEIYIFKTEGKESSLYDSLKKYAENNPESEKLIKFLSELSHYRTLSEGMNIDLLLTRLYHETGLLSLASKQGGVENLYKLYSYARSFESSSYKGLYNFISYVNSLIEKGATIDKNESADAENSVHIGTIHSSKGLEFPVVFLADAASPIVNLDTREKIAFAEDFGISFLLRGPMGLALVENPLHHIILDYMDKKFFEEIIRLLYVALTRAKEKLYVVGLFDGEDAEKYLEDMALSGKALSSFSVRKLKTYLDMICATAKNAEISVWEEESENEKDGSAAEVSEKAKPEIQNGEDNEKLTENILKRFSFVYPREHLTTLPEKMSVSRLYPTVLDGADEDAKIFFSEDESAPAPEPLFISGSDTRKSAKRGIATHYFLQFFDIENLRKCGAESELSRLSENGFISEKNKELVRLNELLMFEKSELLSAMENAKNLYREFRFNTRLPAELFTEDEEKKALYKGELVLVQGVIDCLIENADGSLRLVDYKTDRLTKAELEDESLAAKKLSEKHSLQLSYYALAVEKIFGKAPARVEVYSLPLGKTVAV